MSKYDNISLFEISLLHLETGMTIEINDGHISGIKWEG